MPWYDELTGAESVKTIHGLSDATPEGDSPVDHESGQ